MSIVSRKSRVSSHREKETRSTRSRENDSAPTVSARFSLVKFPPLELSRRKKLTGGDACAIVYNILSPMYMRTCVHIYFLYIIYICIHIKYFCSREHDPSTRIVLPEENHRIELGKKGFFFFYLRFAEHLCLFLLIDNGKTYLLKVFIRQTKICIIILFL